MEIRRAVKGDFDRIMEIYATARDFMVAHDNPRQWAAQNWPPAELVRSDIESGKSYVCECSGQVVGTFFYDYGIDIEPTYTHIYEGNWLSDGPYGVVHRVASDQTVGGVGSACLEWAFAQCRDIRIDTHGDNTVMQNLLEKLGFIHCGIIYVTEDNDPRLAYEKTE